jgi:hypothetical protein
MYEHQRMKDVSARGQRRAADSNHARRKEKAFQGIGNLTVFLFVVAATLMLPYPFLMGLYFLSIFRTIRAILAENHEAWKRAKAAGSAG